MPEFFENPILDGIVVPITSSKNISLNDVIRMPLTKKGNDNPSLILASMFVDWDWLFNSIGFIPMTVLVDGNSTLPAFHHKRSWTKGITHPKNTQCLIIAPFSAPYSKMHVKFAIVMTCSFVRIMITSANLVKGDWEERTNIAYIQDFPISSTSTSCKPKSDFGIILGDLLQSMALSSDLILQLATMYDYSNALGYIISSIPGAFPANSAKEFAVGLGRLSHLSSIIINSDIKEIFLEYQCSSIGPYTDSWLEYVFGLFSGHYRRKVSNGILRIIYPSEASVLSSEIGPDGYTSLFCSLKNWLSPGFPKESIFNVEPIYSIYSLHSKATSLNLTTIDHDCRISDKSTLIRNWELGMLFSSKVEIPYTYARPAKKYSIGDKPWTQF